MTTASQPDRGARKSGNGNEGVVARFGLALANWSERWFPDPLVFAFVGIVVPRHERKRLSEENLIQANSEGHEQSR